jgi:hypothetical protein
MATATIRPLPTYEALASEEATGPADRSQPSSIGLVLLMVAAALAIRLIVVAFVFRDLPDPARHYERFGNEVGWIARSIALHRGFSSPFYPITGPTALLPPLYPALLGLIFKVFGIYSLASAIVILFLNSLFSALPRASRSTRASRPLPDGAGPSIPSPSTTPRRVCGSSR